MSVLEGIVPDLSEAEYHAAEALSSTGARRLLEAPARFLHAMSSPREHNSTFDVGTAAHSKVLGTGWPIVVIPESVLASNGAVSTAAAKAFIAEAREAGQVPVKRAVADEVNAMSESVLAHPSARALLQQEGIPEASVFSTDPATGIQQRARFDYLGTGPNRRVGVDLKTFHGDATPGEFARAVAKHSYHVQDAWYDDTLTAADGHIDAFAFVVIEKSPPYLTAVFVLDEDYREIGRKRAAIARELFRRGVDTGQWPGYPDQIQIVRPPSYVIYDEIDRSNAA